MRILFVIFGLMCATCFVIGCKKETLQLNKNVSFENHTNTNYGKDPEQKMDLYIPRKSSYSKDVFVIIHGGGWRGGDKSILSSFTFSLMEKFPDCIFANINYRLASHSTYALPNQTDDIDSALSFLEKKLNRKAQFILLGNSAGGHLAMLYAYKYDSLKRVKAVVNIVGPSNMSDPEFKNYEDYSFVEKRLTDPEILPANIPMNVFASPINWINRTSAPTLSFYGTKDRVIPISQKNFLDSALHKNSVIHTSFEFNGNHVDWLKEPHTSFLTEKISEFMKQQDQK